jgi:hypothetical protein
MKANLENISSRIQQEAEQTSREALVNWKKSVQAELQPFHDIFQGFLDEFNTGEIDSSHLLKIWQELESTLTQNLQWIQSAILIKSDLALEHLLEGWKNKFSDYLTELPRKAEIRLTDEFWQRQADDSLFKRCWKWGHRAKNRASDLNLKIKNRVRSIFKKKPLSKPIVKRKFSLPNFLEMYFSLPVSDFIWNEWLEVQKQTANLLHEYHFFSEEIKDRLLFLEKFSLGLDQLADQDIVDQFQKIRDDLQKFQTQLDNLSKIDPGFGDRLEKFWQKNEPLILVRWTYAGTLMLPDKKFDQSKIEKGSNSLNADFEKGKSAWHKHFQSEKQEWQKDLELSILQLNVAQICINTIDTVHQKIEQTIVPTYDTAISDVQESLDRFQKIDIEKKSQLKAAIVAENRSLLRLLRQEKLPVMIETILAANLSIDLKNYVQLVDQAFARLSEEHTIFSRKDLEHGIPRSVVDSVPLKALVQDESLRHLMNRHGSLVTEIQSQQEQLLRNISEIDQIVEFNLEAALNLLQEKKDAQAAEQSRQIVIEGLERTINQLNDLKTLSFDISKTTQQNLREMTCDFEHEVHDLTESEKIFALKLKHARARTRQQIIAQGQRIWQVIKNILPIIYRYARRIYEAIHSRFARIQKIAGLTPKAVRMEEELTKFLTETRKSVESLPFVYQRLFRLEPLTDERFFTARKNEIDQLKDGLSNWENGRFAASALVGEKGSGKTTLLNFFQNDHEQDFTFINYTLTETTIIEEDLLDQLKAVLDFKDAKTMEELEAQISESQERKVLICENIHNLFIRTVDGFGTLERFLLFISRTNEKIHWIVTCSLYGWEYLDKVLNISKYFSHVIEMESLPEDDIENIILKRHRVSGYELEFEVTPDIAQTRKFKKLDTKAEQQSYLQDLFFKQLNELASGNVTVALLFWQKAINKVTKDRIVVMPEIQLDHSFLFQMPAEELFTLAALIQHENLDHQQHARIFRQSEQKSELLLERMRNSGILIKRQKGYVIHLFLFRPIVRALKAKNILH